MKENLQEMNSRGVSDKYPVLLGGAALTRAYVEQDLSEIFTGDVRYARDAFDGLRLMDALMAVRRGGVAVTPDGPDDTKLADEEARKLAERKARRERSLRIAAERRAAEAAVEDPLEGSRSDVATDVPIPAPPFFGSRVVKGLTLGEYASMLDERATFMGQWGLRGGRGGKGPSYEELVETEGRPRLRYWLDRLQTEAILEAGVVYGYFHCVGDGNKLIVVDSDGTELENFDFPRQRRDRRLCIADFFRPKESGELDVVAFQIVTMGRRISEFANELFAANNYRDYLEVHGLSVQLTESLAEYWHKRVRDELGYQVEDSGDLDEIFRQGYRGSRYSFGYPACPNLEDQVQLFRLLEPERIGVSLSEEFQLVPEQSTSAIVVPHPEAKYFAAK
jgi:5-methyltetrahydrofolate--homocysteine methyltransferase